MLTLINKQARLTAYTPRAEIHGVNRVPAATLTFETKIPNSGLDQFDPDLRDSFYYKAADNDLADSGHEAPNLRFPVMVGPIKWDDEMIGATLIVHGQPADMPITVDVDDFRLTPLEGGTVLVGFRCACHPDERDSGKLAMLVQTDVEVSLTPAVEPEQETLAI